MYTEQNLKWTAGWRMAAILKPASGILNKRLSVIFNTMYNNESISFYVKKKKMLVTLLCLLHFSKSCAHISVVVSVRCHWLTSLIKIFPESVISLYSFLVNMTVAQGYQEQFISSKQREGLSVKSSSAYSTLIENLVLLFWYVSAPSSDFCL